MEDDHQTMKCSGLAAHLTDERFAYFWCHNETLAEREGFEPPVPVRAHLISSSSPSLPHHQKPTETDKESGGQAHALPLLFAHLCDWFTDNSRTTEDETSAGRPARNFHALVTSNHVPRSNSLSLQSFFPSVRVLYEFPMRRRTNPSQERKLVSEAILARNRAVFERFNEMGAE